MLKLAGEIRGLNIYMASKNSSCSFILRKDFCGRGHVYKNDIITAYSTASTGQEHKGVCELTSDTPYLSSRGNYVVYLL